MSRTPRVPGVWTHGPSPPGQDMSLTPRVPGVWTGLGKASLWILILSSILSSLLALSGQLTMIGYGLSLNLSITICILQLWDHIIASIRKKMCGQRLHMRVGHT